ncbi:MAG: hypothetical protein ACR2FN_09730 [Chitinophagaceae bacterium]
MFQFANAQTAADTIHRLKKVRVLGFPVVSYTPETRTGYGVAGVAIFRLGKNVLQTKPSQVSLGLGYTQNKQQLYYIPFTLYTNKNQYYIYGEAGYYKYNYYFYGIGTNEIPRELYGVNYPRIKLTGLKQLTPNFYAGLRYQYENYQMTETVSGGELSQGIIPGSSGSVSSGAGVVAMIDKRDSILYTTKGYWMELTGVANTKSLGSTNNFQQYSYDVTAFKKIYTNVVWANELFTKVVVGNAPFNQYAILGGNKKLRGFYEGRYRDKHALIIQTEFRGLLYKRFGAAVFGAAGFIGGDNEYVRFNEPKIAYGAGLRYIVNKNDHLNLRIDYAIGNGKGNFYATFGEAF